MPASFFFKYVKEINPSIHPVVRAAFIFTGTLQRTLQYPEYEYGYLHLGKCDANLSVPGRAFGHDHDQQREPGSGYAFGQLPFSERAAAKSLAELQASKYS